MKKVIGSLVCCFVLIGCGDPSLDATDPGTFQESYLALIDGMDPQGQILVTEAMVTVAKASKYGTDAPGVVAQRSEVDAVLQPYSRESSLAQVYVLGHEALDGKTTKDLMTEFYAIETRGLESTRQTMRVSLGRLDEKAGSIASMSVEAKEKQDLAEQQRQRDLEELSSVSVDLLDYTISQFRPPHARGEFVVQVTNMSNLVLEETISRLHWRFGETEGERPLLYFKPGRSFEAGGLAVGETSKPGKVGGINVDLGEGAPAGATADDIQFTVSALSITVDGREIHEDKWENPLEREVKRLEQAFEALSNERNQVAQEVERLDAIIAARD